MLHWRLLRLHCYLLKLHVVIISQLDPIIPHDLLALPNVLLLKLHFPIKFDLQLDDLLEPLEVMLLGLVPLRWTTY